MSDEAGQVRGTISFDRMLGFTIPGAKIRGRVVRIGPLLEAIVSAHDYPPPIKHLLAEALMLTAMMGSLIKERESQLTMQAQAEGGTVSLLVCDYRDGEMRGYVQFDPERLAQVGSSPSLETLFGEGYLAITFELPASDERYQGIVRLEGASLSQACERYFERSEQVPTVFRVGVRIDGESAIAGGLMIQHYPDREEGRERLHANFDEPDLDWERISILGSSVRYDELVDPTLEAEHIVWRLYHEEAEVRIEPIGNLARGCRCTVEHYEQILSRFAESERADMRDDDGSIAIDCAFCSKVLKVFV